MKIAVIGAGVSGISFAVKRKMLHEDDEVVVIAEYSDSSAHDISADLNLLGIEAQDRYSYSNIFNGQSFTIKIKDIASLSSHTNLSLLLDYLRSQGFSI